MIIHNGYIVAIERTDDNYDELMGKIHTIPEAPEGFCYRLRADTLAWELVELPDEPPVEDEPTAEEIVDILLGGDGE